MYGYQNPYYPGPMPDQLAQLRQTPTPQQGNGILWVSGEQEARNYLLAPNSAVALWDSGSPCVYFKQSDASGRPIAGRTNCAMYFRISYTLLLMSFPFRA